MSVEEALQEYRRELERWRPGEESTLPVELAMSHIAAALLEEWGLPTPQSKFAAVVDERARADAELAAYTPNFLIEAIRRTPLETIETTRAALDALDAGESEPTAPAGTRRGYQKVPIPEDVRWEVFDRDGFKCVTCGTRRFLRADHIYPERLGGLATLENLQTLCRSCNSRKGARVPEGGA